MKALRRPRAIAFDLDGTLVDSRDDIVAACNHVLIEAGRPALDPEVIAGYVGDGVRKLVARAFGVPDEGPDLHLDAWSAAFVAYYAAHPAVHTTWMPGALSALEDLSTLPLALVTNKARTVTLRLLEVLGGGERFAFVYAGGDGPLKPHPDPVLAVARALSVDVADLWVVGDSDQDVRAARAAGAVAIAVRGGFADDLRLSAARPDVVLGSLDELWPLVQRAAS